MTPVDSVMAKCARAGQWDHVVRIGGFRSVEDAKKAMGAIAALPGPVMEPERRPSSAHAVAKRPLIMRLRQTPSDRLGPKRQPRATPEWTRTIKARMVLCGYRMKTLAADINRPYSSLINIVHGSSALSDNTRAAIENAATYAESRYRNGGG